MTISTKLLSFLEKLIIFLLILFQIPLQQKFTIFKNIDELLPFILGIGLVIHLIKHNGVIYFNKRKDTIILIKLIFCIAFLLFIGICGNIKYKYQSLEHVLPDIILVFKGFVTYVLVILISNQNNNERYYPILNRIIQIIIFVIFSLTVINYVLKLYPTNDIRWGIPSQMLMFAHPTYLASFAVACLSIMISFESRFPKNKWYMYMLIFVLISTLRSKVIMFIGILFLMYHYIIKLNFRIRISGILILFIIGIYFINDKIFEYLSNPDWSRSALMINSFKVANDHFPLGSGFSTFATWTSGVYYSPLYYKYGLSNIYGLTFDNYVYIGDTFWPAILGQFGYIGCVIVIYMIYLIYMKISLIENKYVYLSKLTILVYLLILSTAETSFMSPVGPLLCLIMAVES
ncbi:hypothetical protein [Turicibacter bilis]|uniref:hypothetical protein n=1 Tax=Turicibacter bilis TaxID=2735723 RepID=UPI0031BAF4B3